ncbi:MAG: hypothetical protein ACODAU_01765 [Myxococcota bacterium]
MLGLIGCGGAVGSPAPRAEPAPAPLGPLALLVPSQARLVVEARPRALLDAPAFRRAIDVVAPPARRAEVARRTGVEATGVRELVVAELPGGGFLVLVRGDLDAPSVVRRIARRMAPIVVSADSPVVRRGGMVGRARREAIALRGDVLAVAGGEGAETTVAALARRARAPAGEGLEQAGALGEGLPLALRAEWAAAPLRLHAPRPLELPPGSGASVLLARQRALCVAVAAEDDEHLRVAVDLRGEFPEGAEQNFRALASSLAASDMGAALGLREGLASLRVQAEQRRVVVGMEIPARTLARGLVLLFGADVQAVLEAAGLA